MKDYSTSFVFFFNSVCEDKTSTTTSSQPVQDQHWHQTLPQVWRAPVHASGWFQSADDLSGWWSLWKFGSESKDKIGHGVHIEMEKRFQCKNAKATLSFVILFARIKLHVVPIRVWYYRTTTTTTAQKRTFCLYMLSFWLYCSFSVSRSSFKLSVCSWSKL